MQAAKIDGKGGGPGRNEGVARRATDAAPAGARLLAARARLARRLLRLYQPDRGRRQAAVGEGAPEAGPEARRLDRLPRNGKRGTRGRATGAPALGGGAQAAARAGPGSVGGGVRGAARGVA